MHATPVAHFLRDTRLSAPRQFQPIYYSCCFDVRLAAGCCDTGNQSKTLVGTTDWPAVGATSRNLESPPAARKYCWRRERQTEVQWARGWWKGWMQSNRGNGRKTWKYKARGQRFSWRGGHARLLLVGCFVCWRFIRAPQVFHPPSTLVWAQRDVHLAHTGAAHAAREKSTLLAPWAIKVIIASC